MAYFAVWIKTLESPRVYSIEYRLKLIGIVALVYAFLLELFFQAFLKNWG